MPNNGDPVNRAEHIQWAKTRALAELDADPNGQGRGKHPDTTDHAGIGLTALLTFGGHLTSPREVRDHINDFH